MSESEKKLDLPDLSLLEAELEREQYKNSFGQVLRSEEHTSELQSQR